MIPDQVVRGAAQASGAGSILCEIIEASLRQLAQPSAGLEDAALTIFPTPTGRPLATTDESGNRPQIPYLEAFN